MNGKKLCFSVKSQVRGNYNRQGYDWHCLGEFCMSMRMFFPKPIYLRFRPSTVWTNVLIAIFIVTIIVKGIPIFRLKGKRYI